MTDDRSFIVEVTRRYLAGAPEEIEVDGFLVTQDFVSLADPIFDRMGDADRARVTVTPIRTEKVECCGTWCSYHDSLIPGDQTVCEYVLRRHDPQEPCLPVDATVSYEVEVPADVAASAGPRTSTGSAEVEG